MIVGRRNSAAAPVSAEEQPMSTPKLDVAFVVAVAFTAGALAGCKPKLANEAQCREVAERLADLKVAQEKQLKVVQPDGSVRGGLLVPPFYDADKEKQIRAEALSGFADRCGKGWRLATWTCMMAANDLEAADLCRVKQQQ